MGSFITKEVRDLREAIRHDPVLDERLLDKCRWENMSVWQVLEEWGDPKDWSAKVANAQS